MNSKKAKRLRQLVRHLQNKSAVESADWIDVNDDVVYKKVTLNGSATVGMTVTRKLKPECGRSIYQIMKKTA